MSMSWSQKIFLQINSEVGKYAWLDWLMKFSAHWLLYIYMFLIAVWGVMALPPDEFKLFVKLLLTAVFLGNIISWSLALVWRHPRPIEEFPDIKEIVLPLQTFRSFPSLHTMMSFIFLFLSILSGAGLSWIILFFVMSLFVSTSRVYVGVHYPRDIIGGIVFALLLSLVAFWLLENISQPAYNLFFH